MSDGQQLWDAVDEHIVDALIDQDAALQDALRTSEEAGLPAIAVTPNQGKLLALLVRLAGARRVLELGTLGGYSTIWLARALPQDGRLITLEANADYARVAQANIDAAGVGERVELLIGPALQTLPQLAAAGAEPFDVIFIDADKNNYPGYFEWSLKLARPGTLLIGDNVVRGGRILDADASDPSDPSGGGLIAGVRRFYELLSEAQADGRISATAVQTVGSKGHDGFALGIVAG